MTTAQTFRLDTGLPALHPPPVSVDTHSKPSSPTYDARSVFQVFLSRVCFLKAIAVPEAVEKLAALFRCATAGAEVSVYYCSRAHKASSGTKVAELARLIGEEAKQVTAPMSHSSRSRIGGRQREATPLELSKLELGVI